jgi:predicted O-methyltransferase YrrM
MRLPETVSLWFRPVRQLLADAEDARAMAQLALLGGDYLPWTSYSMRPSAIAAVLSDIVVNRRRQVVECGSGNSTVYAARLLRRIGEGHVTSVEHDAEWAAVTHGLLERENLQDLVTVVHAPLAGGWYDRSRIPALRDIDLLVIDGPPAHERQVERARQPAYHHFAPSLAPGATVILDDAWRHGERLVTRDWQQASGRRFSLERGGYAIAAPHVA